MSIGIEFGGEIFESATLTREHYAELAKGSTNPILIAFCKEYKERSIVLMREKLCAGEIGRAQAHEGFAECLEDIIEMLEGRLALNLKPE